MSQTDITAFRTNDEQHTIYPENEPETSIFTGTIATSIIEPLARYMTGTIDVALVTVSDDSFTIVTRTAGNRTNSIYATARIPCDLWESYTVDKDEEYVGGIITRQALYDAFAGGAPETTTVTIDGPTTIAERAGHPFQNVALVEETTSHDLNTGVIDTLSINDTTSSVIRDPPGEPMDLDLSYSETVTLNNAYELKQWLQGHGETPERPRLLLAASDTYNRDRSEEYMFTVTEFDAASRDTTGNTYTATGSSINDDGVITAMNVYAPSTPSLDEREHIPDPHLESRTVHWGYYNYDEFAGPFTHALKDTLTDTEITISWQPAYPVRYRHVIEAADTTPAKAVFEMHLAPMIT